MARLAQLFSGKKRNAVTNSITEVDTDDSRKCEMPNFSKDQIRVLLFRDCEWRGRKLLIDSKSVKTVEPVQNKCSFSRLSCNSSKHQLCSSTNNPNNERREGYTETSPDGTVYKYLRPCSDVKMLGEMIFGSAPLSYEGDTFKIHTMHSPSQIMATKIFSTPRVGCQDAEDSCSLQNSLTDFTSDSSINQMAQSVPVDVPKQFAYRSDEDLELVTHRRPSSSLKSNASYGSLLSIPLSSDGSTSSLTSLGHSGSFSNLQRRWLRNMTTSMEFGIRRNCDSNSSTDESHVSSLRRTKLGLSIVISTNENEEEKRLFETFFFNHIAIIESYLNMFSVAVEKAYKNRKQFVTTVMEAFSVLQQSIVDLYTAPRMTDPVWLSLIVPGEKRQLVCYKFVKCFTNVLESCDTKASNFFVSTLLTAVLTNHLAWTCTVSPSEILPDQSYQGKRTAKWLDILAKSHPYNPLWAQLGDLYGAIGFPRKIAKTIVVGKKQGIVQKFVYILSYFVRCSEIYEKVEERVLPDQEHPSASDTIVRRSNSVSSRGSLSSRSNDNRELDSLRTRHESSGSDSVFSQVQEESSSLLPTHNTEEEIKYRVKKNGVTSGNTRWYIDHDINGLSNKENNGEKDNKDSGFQSDFADKPSYKKLLRQGRILSDDIRVNGKEPKRTFRTYLASSDLNGDRDSGISVNSINSGGNNNPNRLTNGKVLFTIGNVPLEDICSAAHSNSRESPERDPPVCTCGKHVLSRSGLQVVDKNSLATSTTTSAAELKSNKSAVTYSMLNAELTYLSLTSSIYCPKDWDSKYVQSKNGNLSFDSGIHSCEPSISDLSGVESSISNLNLSKRATESEAAAIKAMDVQVPNVKVEHIRNVGQASFIPMHSRSSDLTDLIGLSAETVSNNNKCIGHQSETRRAQKMLRDYNKFRFSQDQTSSMFDEYFDENIELKMLDDANFEEKLKNAKANFFGHRHRSKASSNNNKKLIISNEMVSEERHKKTYSCDSLLEKSCECNKPSNCFCDNVVEQASSFKGDTSSGSSSPISLFERSRSNSASSGDSTLLKAVELPIPKSDLKQINSFSARYNNFGHSLTANIVDHYTNGFALQGTTTNIPQEKLYRDLHSAVENPFIDESVTEAVCIIADTDNWTVELASSKSSTIVPDKSLGARVTMSQMIARCMETVLHLWKLHMSAEFCLMHLEDRLQELYFKSHLLAEYLNESKPTDIHTITSALSVDSSDLPLLMAIASTHSQPGTCTYGVSYR